MASATLTTALRQLHTLFNDGAAREQTDAQLLDRFVSRGDATAFEVLLARHGPMVLAVSRGVLKDPHEAEDALQATFLVMVRKARSIRGQAALGCWLHRVAYRVAVHANVESARRRREERSAAARRPESGTGRQPGDSLRSALHEEVARLPEHLRGPVILCYFEGMSHAQAAFELRWGEATVRRRLAGARDLLRSRLARRGVVVSAGMLAAEMARESLAAVPEGWAAAIVRAAGRAVSGGAASAIAIAGGGLNTMLMGRVKMGVAALLALGVTGWLSAGTPGRPARVERSEAPRPTVAATPPAPVDDDAGAISFRGRVLGPTGGPAAGAGLFLASWKLEDVDVEPQLKARADAEGRFAFSIPWAGLDPALRNGFQTGVILLAKADGLGPDWVTIRNVENPDLTLRLVEDDVPIVGRILDLQGRPVVGAKIRRSWVKAEAAGNLDPFLKLVREDSFTASNHNFAKNYWSHLRLPGEPTRIVTDADGRFRASGFGRDRIVHFDVEAPSIQSTEIAAMTRNAATVSGPPSSFGAQTIHGAKFDHLTPPGRTLTGIVRDKVTRKPLAGIFVGGQDTNARATTDVQGRYTLTGFAKGPSYGLIVMAGQKPPYFATCRQVPDAAGLAPIEADMECNPGVLMRLKLVDKETGKPVVGATVCYWPISPNPHTREERGFAPVRAGGAYSEAKAEADGTYILGALPGPGGVFVKTLEGVYRPACVDPAETFRKVEKAGGVEGYLFGDRFTVAIAQGDGVGIMPQDQFSAIVLTNPDTGSGPLEAEVVMERDRPRKVAVLGPDGSPLSGVTADGAEPTAEPGVFSVSKLNPLRPSRITFRHDGSKLVGFLMARGDEEAPYSVRLQPWATITGRLVDAEGRPRRIVQLMTIWEAVRSDPALGILPGGIKTDDDGRFRFERLVPGQLYSGNAVGENAKDGFGVVIDRVTLKPGEVRDLGDVKAKPEP
jgi:RNA polymerase sigma factor (sigma-70 family)